MNVLLLKIGTGLASVIMLLGNLMVSGACQGELLSAKSTGKTEKR